MVGVEKAVRGGEVAPGRAAGRPQTLSFTQPQNTRRRSEKSLGGVRTQTHNRVEIYHLGRPLLCYTTIAYTTTTRTTDMARKSKGSGQSGAPPKSKSSGQSDAPSKSKGSGQSNAPSTPKGSGSSDAPGLSKGAGLLDAPDLSNLPGRFASDPTAGEATRLLQRARRTITYPDEEIVRVGAKTSGHLPEKAFTTLPQFRTAVFRLLVERLKVHGILTDTLKEADFHWCLPTSYVNNAKSSWI